MAGVAGGAESVEFQGPQLLFVYGTLRRGFTNHQRYLGRAEDHGKAEFIGAASTAEKYPLVVRPAHVPPATRAPVLMDCAGTGHRIAGEVFRVDESALEAMDILEGVRSGHYYKRTVVVNFDADGKEATCFVYFFPANKELLGLPFLSAYTEEHHALYRPRPIREEILTLCQPPHGLRTPRPCALTAHCLRLLPGEDILLSLKAFVATHKLRAVAVLTCVGSTGKTTLRPAGVPKPRVFEDKYEIVSLTGTISTFGHHLHMSISDPQCNVYGGHVLEGCIVRTTAEIVLGLLDGVRFTRPVDDRTGYDELSITMLQPEVQVLPDTVPDAAAKRRRVADNPGP